MDLRRSLPSLLCTVAVFCAQSDASSPYLYVSPRPNATMVNPRTTIAIRFCAELLDIRSLTSNCFRVVGSLSGVHRGTVVLSDDQRTVIFRPDVEFLEGERIEVEIRAGMQAITGAAVPPWLFSFTIRGSHAPPAVHASPLASTDGRPPGTPVPRKATPVSPFLSARPHHLPQDFPAIRILKDLGASRDPVFLGTFPWGPDSSAPYIVILNRNGTPQFYKRVHGWDFKVQPNGTLTYYDEDLAYFVAMDSCYKGVNDYSCGNGYYTNEHELRVMPDGHAFLMSYDRQFVRMDTIVPGGNPEAFVTGLIVQELDREKNVVFEWRSWDHFLITDATTEDLTAADIDYVHGNAIEIDPDGNLMISSRNMNEITKINRETGDIIWRWGGKNNQFTIVNDPIGFEYQHAIRRLPNGNVLLFDNGTFRMFSRAVEYALDEENKIATLVWQYRPTPDIEGWALGYSQRLPDGNTLIGWGSANPTATEVTAQGDVQFEMDLPEIVYTYRIYSFPWKTTAFVPALDTLAFPDCFLGDSCSVSLALRNPTDQEIILTSLELGSASFSAGTATPVMLPAYDSVALTLTFHPQVLGAFSDTLEIWSVDTTIGIMQSVILTGHSAPAKLVFTPSALDFGKVARGDSAMRTITIQNPAAHSITLQSTAALRSPFSVQTITPKVLGANDSVSLPVWFKPTAFGLSVDTLRLAYVGVTAEIALRGTCPDPANSVNDDVAALPTHFALKQNYPNPFNPTTVVQYQLPEASDVRIAVYDQLGREIALLVDENRDAGTHSLRWNPENLASGLYFCRMIARPLGDGRKPQFVQVRKIVLVR